MMEGIRRASWKYLSGWGGNISRTSTTRRSQCCALLCFRIDPPSVSSQPCARVQQTSRKAHVFHRCACVSFEDFPGSNGKEKQNGLRPRKAIVERSNRVSPFVACTRACCVWLQESEGKDNAKTSRFHGWALCVSVALEHREHFPGVARIMRDLTLFLLDPEGVHQSDTGPSRSGATC